MEVMRVLSLVVDLWKGRRQMEGGGGEASDVGSCFMSKPTWESIHVVKHASKFGLQSQFGSMIFCFLDVVWLLKSQPIFVIKDPK